MRLRAILLGLLLLLAAAPAWAESKAEARTGPLVVKIHADWCGTCTKLDSTWKELQSRYGESAEFVVLDVTDRDATLAAAVNADRLGIREFFDANKGKTGTIAILDPKTGEAYAVLKGELDPAAYEDPLAEAIGAS